MDREPARILVVDDDAETGEFLKQELSSECCKVIWQGDPRQAVHHFRKGQYPVAILDLKFPGMYGTELFDRLKEKDPETAYIILTAYPSVESVLATLKNGAYDYVRKPYRINDLRKVVQQALEEKGFFIATEALINQRVGRRIREFRMQRDWTITKLAAHTRLSKSLISQIENAKNAASLFTLLKIARSLNVKVMDLVQDL